LRVSRQSYPVKRATKREKMNPLSAIEEEISEAEEESQHPSVFVQLKSMLFPSESKKSTARGLKKRKHSKVTRRRRRKH